MIWTFCLSLAAAEPARIAVVLDASRSAGSEGIEAQQELLQALGTARPDATWAVMAVDAAADWVVQPYADTPDWPEPRLRHGSELAMGISMARTFEPPPTHVVALTDGQLSTSASLTSLGEGPDVHVVVMTPGAQTHRVSDHPLAPLAPGGTVHIAARPAELAAWLAEPSEPLDATPHVPEAVPKATMNDAEQVAAAVRSVVDGCLKKPKHRSLLGPITVETTRDEFAHLDLSGIGEDHRWCLSGALFDLELPASLRDVPRARVEVDLRKP